MRSRPVRVGFRPTPRSTISEPGTSVAAAMKNAAEEKSPGTSTSLQLDAAHARHRYAPVLAAHVHAGCAQHHLRVVARREPLDHRGVAVGQQSREQHARLHLRARDRQLVLDPVQVGALDDHRRQPSVRGSRRSPPCAAADARRGRPGGAGCSRRRRGSSVPRGCPASHPGRIRSSVPGVAHVDRFAARVGAAQPRADELDVRARTARLCAGQARSQLGDRLQRRGGVGRAQVAAHLHAAVRHRADDRGAVRDRLVRAAA